MRALKWTSLAALAALALSTVDLGWALGMVAERAHDMDLVLDAFLEPNMFFVCTGHAFVVNYVFGPWGSMSLGAFCTLGVIA